MSDFLVGNSANESTIDIRPIDGFQVLAVNQRGDLKGVVFLVYDGVDPKLMLGHPRVRNDQVAESTLVAGKVGMQRTYHWCSLPIRNACLG